MSDLFRRIQNDPELLAKEEELKRILAKIGEVYIAMKEGTLGERDGAAQLAALEKQNKLARQGPIWERYDQAYQEAAEAAMG